ncbi:MAG TPA: hypothetical protein VFH63_06875 [candidate division Zixibacteria bacterium]|nr:hypothetical protein [candidate division Zixibacteria bacterium]
MTAANPRTITAAGAAANRRRASGLSGTLRAIYIVWYRDILRWWRERPRIVISLAQPILFLVVFGAGLGSSLGGGFGAADTSYAAGRCRSAWRRPSCWASGC